MAIQTLVPPRKANFTLDGTLASTFTHTPDTSTSAPDFYFNESALAFSKTGMKNISHQMVISTSGLNSNFYLNFDYALYTFPDPAVTTTSSSATSTSTSTTTASSTSSSSSSTPIGAIVGGAIGGLAALVALVAGLLFCYRRKYPKEKHHEDDPNSVFHREIDPFILPAPGPISAAVESSFTDNPSRPASTHPSAFPSSSGRSMITSMVPSTAGLGVGTTAASSALSPLAMATDSKSALRVQRQQELERQMQQIQHQMLDLQNEAAERNFDIGGANGSTVNLNSSQSRATSVRRSVRSPDGTEKSEDVSHLKAQIQAMSEHIAILQDQRDNSEWAQGISDEPPPGYSPAAPSPVQVR
ncbi:hypothetical protein BT96DRAFT_570319 [Gymnopus androsaceus JB14]|uniref:Mid2 domain-containing protein n=1 Tax=Gymnopus androsaceus JB14 TaxID=1447944 RepID=A0A6A4HUC6_9AGAR|nr:hypothetical protein BT96DRAFT_570319 [Gymnopus androsaceus JB14]